MTNMQLILWKLKDILLTCYVKLTPNFMDPTLLALKLKLICAVYFLSYRRRMPGTKEISGLEKKAFQTTVKTDQEQILVDQSKYVYLLEKLVDFSNQLVAEDLQEGVFVVLLDR